MLKGCAIGCGLIVLAAAIVGGVIAWRAPKFLAFFAEIAAQEQERQALATQWTLPADDAPTDALFPPTLDGYRREAADDQAAIPELKIDLPGKHAVYRNDASRVDVYLYRVTPLEKEALFTRVEEASQQGASARTWTKVDLGDDYARIYLWSNRLGQNHLWSTRGRLVVFRTADEEDREPVVRAFFKANATPPPPQAGEPKPAPP